MTVSYSHIFGTDNDSLTGITTVDTTGTGSFTENTDNIEFEQSVDTANALGMYSDSAMVADLSGLYYEVWFKNQNSGDWGPVTQALFGMRASTGLNKTNGSYFEEFRASTTGSDLNNGRILVNGGTGGTTLTSMVDDTLYKMKLYVPDNTQGLFYLDGGAYDNQLLRTFSGDFTSSSYRLNCNVEDSKGSGGNQGQFQVFAAFVHDQGTSWTPAPAAPTSLSATANGKDQIDLTWTDPTGGDVDAATIHVERSLTSGSGFSEITTTATGVQSYSNTSLLPGTQYFYRLRSSRDIAGITFYSSYTSEDDDTTDSPPTGGLSGNRISRVRRETIRKKFK